MEYKRLKNQLRIHWCWLRNNEDSREVYKILKVWIETDIKIQKEREKPSKEENVCKTKIKT